MSSKPNAWRLVQRAHRRIRDGISITGKARVLKVLVGHRVSSGCKLALVCDKQGFAFGWVCGVYFRSIVFLGLQRSSAGVEFRWSRSTWIHWERRGFVLNQRWISCDSRTINFIDMLRCSGCVMPKWLTINMFHESAILSCSNAYHIILISLNQVIAVTESKQA